MSLISCTQDNPSQDAITPFSVGIGQIRHVEEYEIISVTGYVVSPGGSTGLSFLVSGRVSEAGPREGDFVRQGQALAFIDPSDYTFAAKAASAQSEQAQIGFLRAQDEYQRMKFLYSSKSIAPNDFYKFKAVYDAAREQLVQATNHGYEPQSKLWKLFRSKLRGIIPSAAQDCSTYPFRYVALSEWEFHNNDQISRKRLSDTTLRAPYDGFIARRGVEQGDVVSPGRPVFEMVRLDSVEISVGVPETDVRLVKAGQKAVIAAPALPGEQFTGIVRNVSVAADPATRTYM